MKRVAKKKALSKIRVVLYLADSTFQKIEALSDRLDLRRADVLAIAVSRFHMSELMSEIKRKKRETIPEEPCPQTK